MDSTRKAVDLFIKDDSIVQNCMQTNHFVLYINHDNY